MIQGPISELIKNVNQKEYEDEKINFEVLKNLGFFILKDTFHQKTIEKYYHLYKNEISNGKLLKTNHHITEVKIHNNHPLIQLIHEDKFLEKIRDFYEGNVGADYIRVIRKDSENFKEVILHQDTGYQIGSFDTYSLFIALTQANKDNGGLILFPGTHRFGYLGDAGEINEGILPNNYPCIKTDLDPGDILVMHSATWHKSLESKNKKDRVYLEIHIQNIEDPSTVIEILGWRKSNWKLNISNDEIFNNSRVQKIKKMYLEIEGLKRKVFEE